LAYEGAGYYLDGGSIGFFFKTEAGKSFVVFVVNPYMGEGVVERGGRKIQRVIIAPEREFGREQELELEPGSKEERRVISLAQTALRRDLPGGEFYDVKTLLEILESRHFDWKAFEDRGHCISLGPHHPKTTSVCCLTDAGAGPATDT